MSKEDAGFAVLMGIVLLYFAFPRIWDQAMRTVRVLVRGWPPAHLNADGDFLEDD